MLQKKCNGTKRLLLISFHYYIMIHFSEVIRCIFCVDSKILFPSNSSSRRSNIYRSTGSGSSARSCATCGRRRTCYAVQRRSFISSPSQRTGETLSSDYNAAYFLVDSGFSRDLVSATRELISCCDTST
jgi:hypothetical protein